MYIYILYIRTGTIIIINNNKGSSPVWPVPTPIKIIIIIKNKTKGKCNFNYATCSHARDLPRHATGSHQDDS